ncbi:MAG: ABC transporter ATP-binding protein [Acidobacteria bacterium]|nr:ABC transporter ATP-binding protein [Acidobacteriota bacterium]
MSEPIVSVRDVGWRAGAVTVLERVGFDVAPGEFVAMMGRNGTGKSTLLDIIGGLRTPTAGVVALDGRPLQEWTSADRARVVAHLPQTLRADLTMRAEALVLMGRYAHASQWFESADDREIAHAAMRRCDCFQYRDRALGTLSGGERQRVLLAACLAQRPRVLLLDEPTTFLDVDQQLHCFTVLRDEAKQGTACLAVTHDMNLALTFCTRLLVLAEHSLAHDVRADAALAEPAWLRVFSDRLRVDRGANAAAWVRYQ